MPTDNQKNICYDKAQAIVPLSIALHTLEPKWHSISYLYCLTFDAINYNTSLTEARWCHQQNSTWWYQKPMITRSPLMPTTTLKRPWNIRSSSFEASYQWDHCYQGIDYTSPVKEYVPLVLSNHYSIDDEKEKDDWIIDPSWIMSWQTAYRQYINLPLNISSLFTILFPYGYGSIAFLSTTIISLCSSIMRSNKVHDRLSFHRHWFKDSIEPTDKLIQNRGFNPYLFAWKCQ
jgi:hypothetical protein